MTFWFYYGVGGGAKLVHQSGPPAGIAASSEITYGEQGGFAVALERIERFVSPRRWHCIDYRE